MRAITDSELEYLNGFVDDSPLEFIGWGEHQIQLRYDRVQVHIHCDFSIEWPGGRARRRPPFNATLELGHLLGKPLTKFERNDDDHLILRASGGVSLMILPDDEPYEQCVIQTDEDGFVIL